MKIIQRKNVLDLWVDFGKSQIFSSRDMASQVNLLHSCPMTVLIGLEDGVSWLLRLLNLPEYFSN